MGEVFFFWMSKPDSSIADPDWASFLGGMAALTVFVVLGVVLLTVFLYKRAATRRKIHFYGDLFAPYTPMRWIWLAALAALITGSLCAWQYAQALQTTEGRFEVALQIALVNSAISALVSYMLIAFVTWLTPPKFRYRPAPYLHRT